MQLKQVHDTAFRLGWCMLWLASAFYMIVNFIAYEENPGGDDAVHFAVRASVCAIVTITALCIHAHLVDKKVKDNG